MATCARGPDVRQHLHTLGRGTGEGRLVTQLTQPGAHRGDRVLVMIRWQASSIAGLLLTTEAVVVEQPEPEGGMPGGGMPDMGGMM